MTDEEKKAIEIVKNITQKDLFECLDYGEKEYKAIQILLNLIEKQVKVIDEMALHIASSAIVDDTVCMYVNCNNEKCYSDTAIECTKQYFYRKVEENGQKRF